MTTRKTKRVKKTTGPTRRKRKPKPTLPPNHGYLTKTEALEVQVHIERTARRQVEEREAIKARQQAEQELHAFVRLVAIAHGFDVSKDRSIRFDPERRHICTTAPGEQPAFPDDDTRNGKAD